MHKCDDALICVNRALQIQQNATLNAEKDKNIAPTFSNFDECHLDLHNYHDALKYLYHALPIY